MLLMAERWVREGMGEGWGGVGGLGGAQELPYQGLSMSWHEPQGQTARGWLGHSLAWAGSMALHSATVGQSSEDEVGGWWGGVGGKSGDSAAQPA